MDGLTVGWVWWNDDDMAAHCEYVTFDMSEYKSFGRGRWFDSIERCVQGGKLPSQAVADIRADGVDDAPAYRGEPGTIPEGAQPIRLPYKHFLHSFAGYGSRKARRDDDMTFQRAHTFEWRIPADAPVCYIAWHIPNVTEPARGPKTASRFSSITLGPGAWPTCTKTAFRRVKPSRNS